MNMFSLEYTLLATQNALLDVITPELRAVVIDLCKEEKVLHMNFYYDGASSEKHIDLWQCAITEASPALRSYERLDERVERLDYPQALPSRGRYAYLRREPPLLKALPSAENFPVIGRECVDFKQPIGLFVSPVTEECVQTSWGLIHHAKMGCRTVPAKPPAYEIDKEGLKPTSYALLSMQRALLGRVTPMLRAVMVGVEERVLHTRFYYDPVPPSIAVEDWELAITETLADLGPGYHLDARIEPTPSHKVPLIGRFAYMRNGGWEGFSVLL